MTKRFVVLTTCVAMLAASPALAQTPAGLWDATVTVSTTPNGPGTPPVPVDIPFRFEITCGGAACATPKASFFNGDDKVTSTSGEFTNGTLTLSYDEYGTKLEATLRDGRLEGQYSRGTRGAPYPFRARKFSAIEVGDRNIPSIAGLWNVQVKSSKGESAWRLIVRQAGAEASATILRIDGDTGMLTGSYRDGKFVLSHFSGARPLKVELAPMPDGGLTVTQNAEKPLVAMRMDQALAKGLPQPSDPSRFTSVKDPSAPFRFSYPDLEGRVVSNDDAKFQGKVVVVSIGGSWCPNCHDETPFLVELYKKYKSRGLEIVALSFEEEAQLKNPLRLRAFNKRYGVDYTVLLAGDTQGNLNDKIPQAVNLNSYPTTFFLGRDGRVRSVHAGFPSKATGKFHTEKKEEVTALVEKLLAERPSTSLQ
jgi:thiol-disulfide isomerase/thioredoxin